VSWRTVLGQVKARTRPRPKAKTKPHPFAKQIGSLDSLVNQPGGHLTAVCILCVRWAYWVSWVSGPGLTAGLETCLDLGLYYGSCKQSELTACQALSHEKWMMIMMVKSTVSRGDSKFSTDSHWPKGPSLLWSSWTLFFVSSSPRNSILYLPQKCEYLKSGGSLGRSS